MAISRNLKKMRELLRNPRLRSLPGEHSHPDGAGGDQGPGGGCDRMGIAVPLMFLNLLTPPCDCHLCVGLRRRELTVAGSIEGIS